jgi:alpha-tubulin suppressor-like RCC1 family protein
MFITDSSILLVSAGAWHTCAIVSGGKLMCWGRNSNQQLGIGATTDQSRPRTVNLDAGASSDLRPATTYKKLLIQDMEFQSLSFNLAKDLRMSFLY